MTDYDPRDAARLADPYPRYERLRADGPVVYHDVMRSWVVLGHDEAVEALKSRQLSAAWTGHHRPYPAATREQIRPLNDWFASTVLFTDPPDHTRLRAVTVKAFTPRRVAALRPQIERMAADLVDGVADRGEMDLVGDFAYPFPVLVIAALLGVPIDDFGQLRDWSARMTTYMANWLVPAEDAVTATDALREMSAYLREVIERRRADPRDDLISAMIAAEDGRYLDADELVAQCGLLMLAGHETTVNAIGLAVDTLCRHPDQAAKVLADPGLWPATVEELFRYDSSVQFTNRRAIEDVTLGGAEIRAGDNVFVCLGAAGRDGRRYPDPTEFRIDRDGPRNSAFGAGIHYCIGAGLAKLELEVALRELFTRLPGLRPATDERDWRPVIAHRGVHRLPVRWDVPARRGGGI